MFLDHRSLFCQKGLMVSFSQKEIIYFDTPSEDSIVIEIYFLGKMWSAKFLYQYAEQHTKKYLSRVCLANP